MGTSRRPPVRALLLIPGGLALLAGLDSALLLLGLSAPLTTERLPDIHGMLMVLGFVGTVIALERAVALHRWYGYVAPALSGVAVLMLLSPAPLRLGQWFLVGGTASLLMLYLPLWRRQRDEAVLVQAVGALAATGASWLWASGVPVSALLPWLVGFVVLTIAGERLELARIAMGTNAGTRLMAHAAALCVGVVASLLWPRWGGLIFGLALATLTIWLTIHDAARRTIRATGLARYMALCMLAGYAWLLVASAIWIVGGKVSEGSAYDAAIHAVFLGFTLSMIMAHAPVILPAVLHRALPYRPVFLVAVALLHGSLLLRVLLGDAYGIDGAWQLGGALNVAAVLTFIALAFWSALTPRPTGRPAAADQGTRASTTPAATTPADSTPTDSTPRSHGVSHLPTRT